MAEPKTQQNNTSVKDFLNQVEDDTKRQDAFEILKLMEKVTGEKAKMWGASMVGFGSFHYKSERSNQGGDWPLTAFSPRKANLTIYIMPGFKDYPELMEKLGKYKTGSSCLYLKSLKDVDLKILEKLIQAGFKEMKKRYKI